MPPKVQYWGRMLIFLKTALSDKDWQRMPLLLIFDVKHKKEVTDLALLFH